MFEPDGSRAESIVCDVTEESDQRQHQAFVQMPQLASQPVTGINNDAGAVVVLLNGCLRGIRQQPLIVKHPVQPIAKRSTGKIKIIELNYEYDLDSTGNLVLTS